MKINEISMWDLYKKLTDKSPAEVEDDKKEPISVTPQMVGGDKKIAHQANMVKYNGKTWYLTDQGWYIFAPEEEKFGGVKTAQELEDLNKLALKNQTEILSKHSPAVNKGFTMVPDTGDFVKWIADKNVLIIADEDGSNAVKYQRVGKTGFQQWKDVQTGKIIKQDVEAIDRAFDIASGDKPAVKAEPKKAKPKPNKVEYKDKSYTLGDDGKWRRDEDGAVIANKEGQDLLNKQLKPKLQVWQMQTVAVD